MLLVLEVWILKELQVKFAEVRILNGLNVRKRFAPAVRRGWLVRFTADSETGTVYCSRIAIRSIFDYVRAAAGFRHSRQGRGLEGSGTGEYWR